MMSALLTIIGVLVNKLFEIHRNYKSNQISKILGGECRLISWPYNICGLENIKMANYVSIGPGATIYSTKASLIFHEHVVIGPNVTIVTGDHMRIVGRFIDSIKDGEKKTSYDQDIVIESDVWIGANVTILKGVRIGRGSTVAAGSVVLKSCPPYSVIGGVPSKLLSTVFDSEEVLNHEKILYGTK